MIYPEDTKKMLVSKLETLSRIMYMAIVKYKRVHSDEMKDSWGLPSVYAKALIKMRRELDIINKLILLLKSDSDKDPVLKPSDFKKFNEYWTRYKRIGENV